MSLNKWRQELLLAHSVSVTVHVLYYFNICNHQPIHSFNVHFSWLLTFMQWLLSVFCFCLFLYMQKTAIQNMFRFCCCRNVDEMCLHCVCRMYCCMVRG